MSKVEYNSNVVSSILVPTASDSKKYIDSAIGAIDRISYLDGYGIGSIKEKLDDCRNGIVKYKSWLESISEKYAKSDEKVEDALSKIEVPKISRKETLIK